MISIYSGSRINHSPPLESGGGCSGVVCEVVGGVCKFWSLSKFEQGGCPEVVCEVEGGLANFGACPNLARGVARRLFVRVAWGG